MAVNEHEPGCCSKFATTTGLCCFMSENEYKHNPLTEVVQNDKRRCTDVPCCCILLLALISEIILIIYASNNGADPKLLLHGYDSRVITSTPQICDNDNDNGAYSIWPSLDYTDITICQINCDQTAISNLMIDSYSSSSFLNSFCLPNSSNELPSGFSTSSESYQRAVSDLQVAAWLILIMSFVSIIISFLYLKIIACVGRLLIIFTIIVILVGGVTLCWLLIKDGKSNMNDDETADFGEIEFITGIVLSILLFFFILALWFMRKNIELVIKMLNEASHAIRDMKFTLIFPVFISILAMIYITFWIIEALYIYSVKTLTTVDYPQDFLDNGLYPSTQYYKYSFDSSMQDSLKWHFIMLFYISQVIIYYGFMILSGVFADWYFSLWSDQNSKTKKRGNGTAELSTSPILEAVWRVTRYHLGSLAFGSMIITIIRIIRAIVTYIQTKILAKGGKNPLIKCLFCCIQCCLKCCQCIFDKINKEGFIFTTIYGTPYCYSSFTALKLLIHNVGRSVMISSVSKYTELFGRIAIAGINTGFSITIMIYYPYYSSELSSFFLPAVVIFVISYMIAALFMMVFEVAVETIFLCFLVDEEVHNGNAKFANHELTQMSSFLPTANDSDGDDNEFDTYVAPDNKRQQTNDANIDYTAV